MLSRIKVGDLVEVISGKDKKKRGKVFEISKDKAKVKVEGIAVATKFVKAGQGKAAGIEKVERFIHSCKVMPICPKTDKPCRVKADVTSEGKKIRVSVKSGLKI